MEKPYICLCNPHDGEWKVFDFEYGKEKYAPTYGMAITSGETPEEAIADAKAFGISSDDVDVCY